MSIVSEEKKRYLLSTDGVKAAAIKESQRLTTQHNFTKVVLGGHVVHPSLIAKLPTFERIIDIGTANGVWLEELRVNQISSISAYALTHGVDISDPILPLPSSISAFSIHDINKPFPSEGYVSQKLDNHEEQIIGRPESYDFVHSRLLVLAIETDQWVNAIKNMAQLLKPGGFLQLTEVNAVNFQSPNSFFTPPDPRLLKMNLVLGTVAKAFKKDFLAGGHLKSHLVDAGLKKVNVVSNVYPVGKIAEEMFGFDKSNNGVAHQMGVFRSIKGPFLSSGGDTLLQIKINTEEQFDVFMAEFEAYLQEVGCFVTLYQVVGEK